MSILLLLGDTDTNPRSLFANNEPGVWYDPAGTDGASEAKRAWRRNLVTWSEQLDNSAWTKNACAVTANAGNDYLGNATADKIIPSAGSVTNPFIRQDYTATINASYTFSFDAKASGYNIVQVFGSSLFAAHSFDLSNGTTSLGSNGTITSLGNGWYRCSVTSPATASSVNYRIYALETDGVSTFTADGTSGILVSRVQFEQSSTPTDYQPITDFSSDFLAAYPTHSLYTNTTGTSPAIYPGDLVALQIDQSRGGLGSLGAELLSSADSEFSSDTGFWTKQNGTITISSGALNFSSTGDGVALYANDTSISAVEGQFFRYSFTINSITSGGVRFGMKLGYGPTATTPGTYTGIVRAINGGFFGIYAVGTTTAVIDNVSIKRIPGTHRYATTDANRPKLARIPEGGRRNLLTYSEQFDNAAWTKTGTGTGSAPVVTANQAANPLTGEMTADLVVFNLNGGTTSSDISQISFSSFASAEYTTSFYAKTSDGTTKAMVLVGAAGTAVPVTITGVWQRLTTTGTGTGSPRLRLRGAGSGETTADSASIHLFGWQHELGSTATAYQRVTLTEDVTETGKRDCWGLWYQGSQSMITPSVDFSGTAQMTVIAGVRKLSDAAIGVVVELSVSSGSINGSFMLTASGQVSPIAAYGSTLRGNALIYSESPTSYAAPISNVVSLLSDISQSTAADEQQMRINGTQVALATVGSNAGTGNFRNDILYIGRRAGTSNPFNGYDFGIIIRGAATTDSTIRAIEKWMAQRTGITI